MRKLQVYLYSEAGAEGWSSCHLSDISELLRRTFEQLIKEDIVNKTAAELDSGVEFFARTVVKSASMVNQSAVLLGISGLPIEESNPKKGMDVKVRESVSQDRRINDL